MTLLDEYCREELTALEAASQRRVLRQTHRTGVMVEQDGKNYVSFSCNDYLGLSEHPQVIAAADAALKRYGAGAGASRLVTGNHPLYAPLERAIAAQKHTEAALVFGSGYLANLGTIPALMGAPDIIFADKLVHACLLDGAQLSGATVKRFKHNDMGHLAALVAQHRPHFRHALILVDHVYSMDGDVAPLAELAEIAAQNHIWLMVDDAHGLGVVPSAAQGVDIWMGTLSKAAGAYGGYVAAKKSVIDLLVTRARSLVFSTGLPAATCAAALTALELIAAEPARGERAVALANRVCAAMGLPPTKTTILPIIMGDAERALAASEALKRHGILAVAIRPPTVPPATARLRLTFSSAHTDAQVEQLIAALRAEGIAHV